MSEEFLLVLLVLIVDIAFGIIDMFIRLKHGVRYVEKTEEQK